MGAPERDSEAPWAPPSREVVRISTVDRDAFRDGSAGFHVGSSLPVIVVAGDGWWETRGDLCKGR